MAEENFGMAALFGALDEPETPKKGKKTGKQSPSDALPSKSDGKPPKSGPASFPRPPPRKAGRDGKLTLPKRGGNRSKNVGRVSGKALRLKQEDSELDSLMKLSADLDAALTTGAPPTRKRFMTTAAPKSNKFAFLDESNVSNFNEVVADPAMAFPFELDIFQKRAIIHIEREESVFVAAHTSAGKTVVAEYAIQLAALNGEKVIYTSPIKTLSNQKYRDFSERFEDVGLVTGDVSINPEAQCTIMTTEILRSMLYRSSDVINDVKFVVFDEVQYLNDEERGVVWEESIIMLPPHIAIIMLSATVPNALEFASWVGRTRNTQVAVVTTSKRPVPLEHAVLHRFRPGNDTLKRTVILQQGGRFLSGNYNAALEEAANASGANKVADRQATGARGGRGGGGAGREGYGYGAGRGGGRGGSAGRGRGRGGGPGESGRGRDAKSKGGSRSGGKWSANNAAQRTASLAMATTGETNKGQSEWKPVVDYLVENDLTPTVLFCFSKKKCESAVESLANVDLLPDKTDKAKVHQFFEAAMQRLCEADRLIPQVQQVRENLKRGMASHHAGLLPIIKEVTEMLFSEGFVRVLFATETFAMGVNMPARAVVFTGLRKNDGRRFRNLEPGEYTQMAGRAGRRGIDQKGSVILYFSSGERDLTEHQLREVLTGQPITLKSAFRLTYNMILNILRVDELRVEEMMKKSFSEAAGENKIDSVNNALEKVRAALDKEAGSGSPPKENADDVDQAPYSVSAYAKQIVNIGKFRGSEVPVHQRKKQKDMGAGRIIVSLNEHSTMSLGVIFSPIAQARGQRRGPAGSQKDLAIVTVTGVSKNPKQLMPKSVLTMSLGAVDSAVGGDGKSTPDWRRTQRRGVELTSPGGLQVRLDTIDSKSVIYVSDLQERMPKSREKKQADAARQWMIDGSVRDIKDAMSLAMTYLDSVVGDWAQKAAETPETGFPAPLKSHLVLAMGGGGNATGAATTGPAYNMDKVLEAGEHEEEIANDFESERLSAMRQLERVQFLCTSEKAVDVLCEVPAEERATKVAEAVQKEKIRLQMQELQEFAQVGNVPSLLPEYHKRVKLLQNMQYVGGDGLSVQLKGRCACEVATVDSVVLTELVLENVLAGLDSSEVASLLSALICRKKNGGSEKSATDERLLFSPAYMQAKKKMREVVTLVGKQQEDCGIGLDFDVGDDAKDYEDAICRWELCEVVLKWAQGATFASLADLTSVQAGDIVVCIKRLSELLKDTQSVANAVGDTELGELLEEAMNSIQRDIIFSGSLYIE